MLYFAMLISILTKNIFRDYNVQDLNYHDI